MPQTSSRTRRDFLRTSVAAAATATLPLWTPRASAQNPASERLTIGSIGTGVYTNRYTGDGDHPGRGMTIALQAATLGDTVAVADVNLAHGRFFRDQLKRDIDIYQDYRRLLERKDIDAVTIGTPDHWHVKIAIDAMRAGKHVYCEKPLSLTVAEGRQLVDVMKQTGRVVQVGTQQRSEYGRIFLKAVAIARSGRLGRKLHALVSVGKGVSGGPFENSTPPPELDWDMWLGQTPQVPYCRQRCDYDFRWWLEYSGGQVTDWGVHHMDIALWAMGLENTGPVTISGRGTYPDIPNGFNVATDFDCELAFADGQVCRLFSGKNELILSGEKGRIRVNRGGLTGRPVEELTKADEDELNQLIVELCHGYDPQGENGSNSRAGTHMRNFFDCVRDGRKTISDPETHHRSVSACHLANIAMILDRPLTFDPDREVFPDDAQATGMLAREQRKKYAIDS